QLHQRKCHELLQLQAHHRRGHGHRGQTARGAHHALREPRRQVRKPAVPGREVQRRSDDGRMHPLIKRTRPEEGFVMVIAVFISAIVLLLGAGIVAASVTTSSHATHEYGRSDALAAANAGLEAALHRLSGQGEETSPQEKQCFTAEFVAEIEKGLCPASATETVAGGASYKYYVSPVLSEAGNECTGLWVSSSGLLDRTITQRCVTAVGIAEDKVQ